MYKKYGRFHIKDYLSGWIATFVFVVAVGCGVYTDMHILLLAIPTLLVFYFPASIIIPNLEKFSVNDDVITVQKNTKTQQFTIPENCVIVVAYADFCPLFADKFQSGNHTYMLNGRYSVTILHNISLDFVLSKLHYKYARKYTTTIVENSFNNESDLIYSFVCTNEQLEDLIKNRECRLIIPESLKNIVQIKNTDSATIFYDEGY